MRIGVVSPYALTLPGGVQGQVAGLARAYAAAGHEVLVCCPGPPGEAIPGAEVHGVGHLLAVPVNGSRAPVAPSPLASLAAARVLARFSPDVVHVHEPFVPGPPLAPALARPPVLATFHRAGASRLYRLTRPYARALARRLDDLVAVSSEAARTAAAVLGCDPERLGVLPNAVDVALYTREAATTATAPGAGAAGRLVFVGRHEERKGLAVLLEAVERLPSASLSVVGTGPETARLRAAYGSNPAVSFLGALGDKDKARQLAAADVFVAPSLSGESFGVVLLEAMAAGTAVVCSDLPGYRLAAGEAAAYVPPGDPAALAARLSELLADPAERDRLAALGRARAASHDFAALARTYLGRLAALAGAGRSR